MSIEFFPEEMYPSSMEANIEFNNVVFTSPYNNSEQFERRPGERWVFKLVYKDLEQEEARDLHGFLLGLQGMIGQFYVKDYAFYTRRGRMSGNPVVDGSDNQGNLCKLRNCPANRDVLLRGDYIKINNRLHMVKYDCRSASDGTATVEFVPRMLSVPTDGQSVIYDDFTVVCRLKDDKQAKRSSNDMVNSFSFEAVEVL